MDFNRMWTDFALAAEYERFGMTRIAAAHNSAIKQREQGAKDAALLKWAVSRWNAEVLHRPLVNVHRRTLDDTWRQVIRHAGGDDVVILGPRHDDLVAMAKESGQ